MANTQNYNERRFVDKRLAAVVNGTAAANQHSDTFSTNTNDVASMRARLTAISAATYPAATLDKMTTNDMLYAIRLNDEAASI